LRKVGFAPLPQRPRPDRRPFPTPSGRFEFASDAAEAGGHGLLPNYRAGSEASDLASGHLALIAGAGDFHINSTFAGTEKTAGRTGTPELILHPRDAEARRLDTGDRVTVANDRGCFDATVTVSDRTRPGVAAITKGWWDLPINNTVAERDADMASGAIFHDNAVTVIAAASKPKPGRVP
ncbi:MAG: molybdopterin dinucleotide binding domain-containing protein, partial [Acidimicrobiales bacterium]